MAARPLGNISLFERHTRIEKRSNKQENNAQKSNWREKVSGRVKIPSNCILFTTKIRLNRLMSRHLIRLPRAHGCNDSQSSNSVGIPWKWNSRICLPKVDKSFRSFHSCNMCAHTRSPPACFPLHNPCHQNNNRILSEFIIISRIARAVDSICWRAHAVPFSVRSANICPASIITGISHEIIEFGFWMGITMERMRPPTADSGRRAAEWRVECGWLGRGSKEHGQYLHYIGSIVLIFMNTNNNYSSRNAIGLARSMEIFHMLPAN